MIVSSVVLVLAIGTGVVLAFIIASDDPIKNDFEPANVSCAVIETFDGEAKTDVRIKNTGNVNAYVRATIVVTWESESNANEILATQPRENVDYQINWGDDSWIRGSDDYWYYTYAVSPEQETGLFIESLSPVASAPEGYRLSVEILASAIQTEPQDVVEKSWKVTNSNGTIVPEA